MLFEEESGGAGKRVLVVDGSLEVRQRLCSWLSEGGDIQAQACLPIREECQEAVERFRPCCVIVDIPVDTPAGYQLLDFLRNLAPEALLVVLTHHHNQEFRERSLRAGVDHFLHKVSGLGRLLEVVQSHGRSV